jgi:hypothetical protein
MAEKKNTDIVDLTSALKLCASSDACAHINEVQTYLIKIKALLEPESITISDTNIFDGIDRLKQALKMMGSSTSDVFKLIERQEELINSGAQIELSELQSISQAILLTQEVQDLAGQSIVKVIKLLERLGGDLTQLLTLFGLQPLGVGSTGEESPNLGQSEADQILEGRG